MSVQASINYIKAKHKHEITYDYRLIDLIWVIAGRRKLSSDFKSYGEIMAASRKIVDHRSGDQIITGLMDKLGGGKN